MTRQARPRRERSRPVEGRTSVARGVSRLGLYSVLVCGGLISLAPLIWALFSSLKTNADIFTYPPRLMPDPWTIHGYQSLFAEYPFITWFVNSVLIASISTVLGVFFCALAGFAFAKYEFRGKDFLFSVVLASMMVPLVVIVVPLFLLFSQAGWADSYGSLILPWLAPGFGVFMMRQFISSVPDEMLDAARIDGASEFTVFMRMVLPVSRPALAALGVWLFLNVYNAFLWPLISVTSQDKLTLPVGLNSILSTQGASATDYSVVMAGAVIAAVPSIIIFVVLRKQFIAGLTLGSVKG